MIGRNYPPVVGQAATDSGSDKVTGAVITIPAAFNQNAIRSHPARRQNGRARAGRFAAGTNGRRDGRDGRRQTFGQFLVYDLGGGTFDVALAQSVNGEVTIVAHQGINMLGGRDFDRMMVNELVRSVAGAEFRPAG